MFISRFLAIQRARLESKVKTKFLNKVFFKFKMKV